MLAFNRLFGITAASVFVKAAVVLTVGGAYAQVPERNGAEHIIETALAAPSLAVFERCFGKARNYGEGMRYYHNILQEKSGKICMMMVIDTSTDLYSAIPRSGGRFIMRTGAVATGKGMNESDCGLKALSCLQPSLAKTIARKYGLKIEPTPFQRQ